MKATIHSHLIAAVALPLLLAVPCISRAQVIYAPSYHGDPSYIGEYNGLTGAAINPTFITITGLTVDPTAVALSGSDLFVNDQDYGYISEYNAVTGATIQSKFLSLGDPQNITVSGGVLYVAYLTGATYTIGAYNASTGLAIAGFADPNGQSYPEAMTISNGNLYISNYNNDGTSNGTVAAYNAATGAPDPDFVTINSSLPSGIAISGNDLFVAGNSGIISEYNASTGAVINASYITNALADGLAISGNYLYAASDGNLSAYNLTTAEPVAGFTTPHSQPQLQYTDFIAVTPAAVPEATSWMLFTVGSSTLLLLTRRKKSCGEEYKPKSRDFY